MSGPQTTVDLNADVGESFGRWQLGDDEALLGIVSSANVACGFHAGDPATLVRVCRLAATRGVVVGAQVGYRDLAGFGRRFIDVTPEDLYADVVYQIGALDGIARSQGTRVAYVKPHGALYNAIVEHETQADAVVAAVGDLRTHGLDGTDGGLLPVLGLPGSTFLRSAERAGLRAVAEAFADRAYTPEGTLVSRREEGAVLHDPELVTRQVLQMVTEGVVTAVDGTRVPVDARSICLHGDSPGAVQLARSVRAALTDAGVRIASFVPHGSLP